MTKHTRGNCEVVVETPNGEMLTIGFMSQLPLRDEDNYSKALCTLIDRFYESDSEKDLFGFLFRHLLISNFDAPTFIRKDKNEERDRIGKRIREIRESLNMEAKELALRVGIDAANLCRIEQGRYSAGFDILTKIAYALGQRIDFVPLNKED